MMGRGAPNKKGLNYFPKMVDFYDDDKIFDLMDEYGPLGVTIYDVILTIIYANGYYIEASEDKLSRMVIRRIGNKWVRNQKAVVQVIHRCSDLGLLDKSLLDQGVITSEGIQKRYHKIAVKLMKRQLYNDKYWLLEKEEEVEPFLKSAQNRITSEENRITSEENRITSEESPIKRKETKRIEKETSVQTVYFDDPELNRAFCLYLTVRKNNGQNLCKEQIALLKEELLRIPEGERLATAKKAAAGNWTGFHALKKNSKEKNRKKNAFSNFTPRSNDYSGLEDQLLNAERKKNQETQEDKQWQQ